jgi:hypothetical protein
MAVSNTWSRAGTLLGKSAALKYGPREVPLRIIKQGMAVWIMVGIPKWRLLDLNMCGRN